MNTKHPSRAVRIGASGRGLLQSLLLAFPLTLCIGAAMLFLTAFAVFRTADPAAYVSLGGYAALAVTALLSGILAGRLHRRRGWVAGAVMGAVLAALLPAVSALMGADGDTPLFLAIALHTAVFLLCLLGGVLGGAERVRKKRRR